MAEHLTQDVDPRLAQSVVDSTTGADGVTTLSNAHGVDVAAVVPGEEANANKISASSNGVAAEGVTTNDASMKEKRDDSPAGVSGTESTKSGDKPATQKVAASRKPPAIKSVSLNKAFLSGNASAVPAQPGSGKLSLSLDKGSKGNGVGTTAASTLAPKPRLVSKIGPSGSRIVGIGQLGGKAGGVPSVWNRNQPPAPVPAKEYTDEELSKHGIHMAERLHTDDSKEAKWADIDDEDDNWVPPDTIEWNDGTKVTLDAAEIPKPVISAFEKQIGTAALKEQRAAHALHLSPTMSAATLSQPPKPPGHHELKKPELIPSMPPPKTPWASVPSGQFPTPRPISSNLQQFPGRQPPPGARPTFVNTQTQSAKEVAADDFSRPSWRDRQSSQSPSTLFNSETGNFDPVGDGNRNQNQGRRNSRNEGAGVRPTSLLQRQPGRDHEHDTGFHHQNRFPGRQEHDNFPSPGHIPMDMGRRRSASIRSSGLSDTSSTAWDNRHPPASNNVAAMPGGGAIDANSPRLSQGTVYMAPAVGGVDPKSSRVTAGPPGPQAIQPGAISGTPLEGAEVTLEPGENPLEAQKRVMRDAREQARARRLAEEAAAEEEKKLRIQKKLAELDEKMKAEAASKAEKNDVPAPAVEADPDTNSPAMPPVPPAMTMAENQQPARMEDASSVTGGSSSHTHTSGESSGLNGPKLPAPPQQPNQATTQITTQTTHPLSPIHQHNNTTPSAALHHTHPHNLPAPPSSLPSSSSVPFTHSTTHPSSNFSSSLHSSQQPSPAKSFSNLSSTSFTNQQPFQRYTDHPHQPHLSHPQLSSTASSSSSYTHSRPPHSYNLPSTHHSSDYQGTMSQVASGRFASQPAPVQPVNGHSPLSSYPHSTRHSHENQDANMPRTRQPTYPPVDAPREWKNGASVSPWAPTPDEAHLKNLAVYPTPSDAERAKPMKEATVQLPSPKTANGTKTEAPEVSGKPVSPTGGDRASAATAPPAPEQDLRALAAQYPNLRQLANDPKTKDKLVPGSCSTTYKNLFWAWQMTKKEDEGNKEMDKGFNELFEQHQKDLRKLSAGPDVTNFNISKAEERRGKKPTPEKTLAQEKLQEEIKKFDDVQNKIMGVAGGGFVNHHNLNNPHQPPRWREPPKTPWERENFKEPAVKAAYEKRVIPFRKAFDADYAAWWKREQIRMKAEQDAIKAAEDAKKAAEDAKKAAEDARKAAEDARKAAAQDAIRLADKNLQVVSKPTFQYIRPGKPRVSLPRPIVRPQVTEPELPNTVPTEDEFKEMAFQQEFGSTPTVCLPTMQPTGIQYSGISQLRQSPKRGKDKARLRDYDVTSRPSHQFNLYHIEPLSQQPGFQIKMPGTEGFVIRMSMGYEVKHNAQNRLPPRANSGPARPRGPNPQNRRNQPHSVPPRMKA